jgi:hypothetical protein
MTDRPDLERRYRRLVLWYPKTYRRENGDEIISVLMAGAREGQRRPRFGEAVDLIAHAVWMRVGPRTPRSEAAVRWAVRLMYLCAAFRLFGLPVLPVVAHHAPRQLDIGLSWGAFAALAWANSRAHHWARVVFAAWFAAHSLALGYDLAHVSTATPTSSVIASVVLWLVELCALVLILGKRSRAHYSRTTAQT